MNSISIIIFSSRSLTQIVSLNKGTQKSSNISNFIPSSGHLKQWYNVGIPLRIKNLENVDAYCCILTIIMWFLFQYYFNNQKGNFL